MSYIPNISHLKNVFSLCFEINFINKIFSLAGDVLLGHMCYVIWSSEFCTCLYLPTSLGHNSFISCLLKHHLGFWNWRTFLGTIRSFRVYSNTTCVFEIGEHFWAQFVHFVSTQTPLGFLKLENISGHNSFISCLLKHHLGFWNWRTSLSCKTKSYYFFSACFCCSYC
jgi:hypothetical protein